MDIPLIVFHDVQSTLMVPLPPDSENLFSRLIRDPTAPDRPVRERQCTEMVRSVLIHCPQLREQLFNWLAGLVGCDRKALLKLEWQIETEQAIGSKRDDLRIGGWPSEDPSGEQVVLWTVEVKASAPLHYSSCEGFDDAELLATSVDLPREEVVQLVNYDCWLSKQPARHRAGFVLAVTDLTSEMPTGLREQWRCVTWTSLGRQLEQVLGIKKLPATETLLAEHMLGFIRRYLWSGDMTCNRLELEDVAILRAFARIGIDCERKVNSLVAGLEEIIRQSGLATGRTTLQKTLFRTYVRSVVFSYLVPDKQASACGSPAIMAGVLGDEAVVWIESSPPGPAKALIRKLGRTLEAALQSRNPSWRVMPDEDRRWYDITVSMPLVKVLAADDQREAMVSFVRAAIEDMRAVGFAERLLDELQRLGSVPAKESGE